MGESFVEYFGLRLLCSRLVVVGSLLLPAACANRPAPPDIDVGSNGDKRRSPVASGPQSDSRASYDDLVKDAIDWMDGIDWGVGRGELPPYDVKTRPQYLKGDVGSFSCEWDDETNGYPGLNLGREIISPVLNENGQTISASLSKTLTVRWYFGAPPYQSSLIRLENEEVIDTREIECLSDSRGWAPMGELTMSLGAGAELKPGLYRLVIRDDQGNDFRREFKVVAEPALPQEEAHASMPDPLDVAAVIERSSALDAYNRLAQEVERSNDAYARKAGDMLGRGWYAASPAGHAFASHSAGQTGDASD